MIVGIGCDIVEIKRFLPRQEALAKKILTPNEYAEYTSLAQERALQYVASRFAAKEAIIKAYDKPLLLSDIEIIKVNNKPTCIVDDATVHLSIAHEKEYTIAYAMCER